MTVRVRTRADWYHGTRGDVFWGGHQQHSQQSLYQRTEDVIGPGDCAYFYSVLIERSGGQFTGRQFYNYPPCMEWNGYPVPWITGSESYDHLHVNSPSDGALASQLVSRTNPSREGVDLAVSLVELREIPGMVRESLDFARNRLFRHIPERLFRRLGIAAKMNLFVQFGILPILSDVEKLLIFQKLVDQRVKELQKLKTKGLRRTIPLFSDSAHSIQNKILESAGMWLESPVTKNTTLKIRGHIRWALASPDIRLDEDIRKVALDIVINKRMDITAVYNLLPWSWLVDYFTNVGDIVDGMRNKIPATCSDIVIMRNLKTETTFPEQNPRSWFSGHLTPYKCNYETKSRVPATPAFSASFDFLEPKQLSILGSLATIKTLR